MKKIMVACFLGFLVVSHVYALEDIKRSKKKPTSILVKLSSDSADVLKPTTTDEVIRKIYKKLGTPKVSPVFGKKTATEWEANFKKVSAKFKVRAQRRPSATQLPKLQRYYKLNFPSVPAEVLQKIVQELQASPNVESASLDHIIRIQQVSLKPKSTLMAFNKTPNDPYFSSSGSWGQSYRDLWGLQNMKMEKTWTKTTGSASVIVAVVDTGLDFRHEDISDNYFTNSSETAGNGIDDDGNGYVDDIHGYDFVNLDADSTDDHGHGTHVSGTIAAQGDNGVGIVGIMWDATILPVKVLDSEGSGSISDVADGIVYASDMGADVINLSLGGSGSSTLEDAINYAWNMGVVVVAAAGNNSSDAMSQAPAMYKPVITVASVGQDDKLSSFSNYGIKIDVAAPGGDDSSGDAQNILSFRASGTDMSDDEEMIVGTNYYRALGTSMATPHVAGLVGLLLSYNPSLTVEEVRQALRMNTDDVEDSEWDTKVGYGRVNAYKTLGNNVLKSNTYCEALITSPEIYALEKDLSGGISFEGYAGGKNFGSYEVLIYEGTSPASGTLFASSGKKTTNVSGSSLFTAIKLKEKTRYSIDLLVYDKNGTQCGRDIVSFFYSPFEADVSFKKSAANELLGSALASGDINNDGVDDLLIGSATANADVGTTINSYGYVPSDYGRAYLVWGGKAGLAEGTSVDDTAFVPISWMSDNYEDRLGLSVEIGNIDGDGYSDVILGLPGATHDGKTYVGKICLFLGKNRATWTRDMNPENDADFCLYGEGEGDRLGLSIDTGDLDSDGSDEIVTSACGNDNAGTGAGKIYVVWSDGFEMKEQSIMNPSSAWQGVDGNAISCESSYFGKGLSVAIVGDLKGDGKEKIAIGTRDNNITFNGFNTTGSLYLLTPTEVAKGDEQSLSTGDIILYGDEYDSGDAFLAYGAEISGVGDVNGDGLDDLLVGIGGIFTPAGNHLVLGDKALSGSYTASSMTTGEAWFDTYLEDDGYSSSGYKSLGIGDINGDGLNDMVMATYGLESVSPDGLVYLKLGSATDFSSLSEETYLEKMDYFVKDSDSSESISHFGYSLASGDFNCDGKTDLAVGTDYSFVYIFYDLEDNL